METIKKTKNTKAFMIEHTKEYLQFLNHWVYIHAEQLFGGATGVTVGVTTTPPSSGDMMADARHIAFIFVCGIAGAMGGTLWKWIVSKYKHRKRIQDLQNEGKDN